MSSNQFVLFDLTSKSTAWSLNPWKTRFLLNFKGLDYTTHWVEYPDIKPTLEAHVGPNESTGTWTIPTVKFPDGSYVMDSRKIVNRIEKEYPEPSVHLDSPVLAKLEATMPGIMGALRPIYFLAVPRNILNEGSLNYWYETRAKTAGMPLDQLEKEKGGQQAWDAAQPVLHEVEALLKENTDGPFFLGKTISYADFQWGGFLIFIQRGGHIDDLYKISGDAQLHKNLLEALASYSARNDH
ncbi:Fc.00g019750.m01.CDS01 [Cosmosporella sp. VM-42]